MRVVTKDEPAFADHELVLDRDDDDQDLVWQCNFTGRRTYESCWAYWMSIWNASSLFGSEQAG
jgi:hypothetical protein